VARAELELQLDPEEPRLSQWKSQGEHVRATTGDTPVPHHADELAVSGATAISIAAREIVARTRREQHVSPTVQDPVVLERLAVLIGHAAITAATVPTDRPR